MIQLIPLPVATQVVFVLFGQCAAIYLKVFANAIGTYRKVI
ncbi:MAG: hypothetical protein PHG67_09980 [Bacteroidales bacterium]|nr:hypothetical protein [Bacteroidales bacterium]HRX01431.1 hypothetical protein [Cyclobacteriaceae bacterium]